MGAAGREQTDRPETLVYHPAMLRLPTVFVGRYRLERQLGEGSFSHTYLAVDMRLGRQVAVKVLRPEHAFDASLARRFRQEARIAASISSEHVVEVYDYDQHDDHLFIVSEWVDGVDLGQALGAARSVRVVDACRITRDILIGLEAVHQAGILHRDVKPQNVLIPRQNKPAKIADFGIARGGSDPSLTQAGETIGTPAYMSPEQAAGQPLGPPSDLYSVAVILYQMVTGELPFSGTTSSQVMAKQITAQAERPRSLNPNVPPAVEGVILRGLAKDPAHRYQSASEMSRAIAEALSAKETAPPSPPITQREPDVSPRASRPRKVRRRTTFRQRIPPYSVSLLMVTAGVILGLAVILASC
jgi:eukaryotic-like serine/threonine-protein kinase